MGSAYIVQRRSHAPYDQTNLNLWFRLILIGGGKTFQKLGPFGVGGWPVGPTTGPVDLVWAPLGVHFGQVGP
jgi:hypothetical protein